MAMTPTKPSRSSTVEIDPSELVDRDPVGLPMVDVRGHAHIRRITIAAQDRGPQRGRIGVAPAVLGVVSPDEIDAVCADLQAMKAAALAHQRDEDHRDDLAREAQELADGCRIADLQAALEDETGLFLRHDVEVIEDALLLLGQRPYLAATT